MHCVMWYMTPLSRADCRGALTCVPATFLCQLFRLILLCYRDLTPQRVMSFLGSQLHFDQLSVLAMSSAACA